MAYIKDYWDNRGKRAAQAKEHTAKMEDKYKDVIERVVRHSSIYGSDYKFIKTETQDEPPYIKVEDLDSVAAIMKYAKDGYDEKVAVLNFSSYKYPGGAFIDGSKAQEECLCHESFLYNVLSRIPEFYEWNNSHKNKALYLNRCIYSPRVLFKRDTLKVCDVITCAAPNKSAAQQYQNVSDEENTEVLRSRIKFVLDVAKDNSVDVLILGAYGCGVFGQDAKEVASIFKEYLNTTHKCFDMVVFAVPSGKDGNLDAFRKVFV
jgi:uncharacterized protein (TIGR02452 family)